MLIKNNKTSYSKLAFLEKDYNNFKAFINNI